MELLGRFIALPAVLCPPARPRCMVFDRLALKFCRDLLPRCWANTDSWPKHKHKPKTMIRRNNMEHLAVFGEIVRRDMTLAQK